MADETKPIVWKVCQTYYVKTDPVYVEETRAGGGTLVFNKIPAFRVEDPVCSGAGPDPKMLEIVFEKVVKPKKVDETKDFAYWSETGKKFVALRGGIAGKPAATVADAQNNLVLAELAEKEPEKRKQAQAQMPDWKIENGLSHGDKRILW